MANQNPEQIARDIIDEKLRESGYIIQDKNQIDLTAGLGVVVREYQTNIGPMDYCIFINRKAVGVIEAKSSNWGEQITTVETQSEDYANADLKWIVDGEPLRFIYEATDVLTRFRDRHDLKYRSRTIFTFHTPEELFRLVNEPELQNPVEKNTLRNRLKRFPELNKDGLRDCQINAIEKLETSLSENRPRALIQMATGAGKTYTAVTEIYRLIKHCGAKRVLFLVDTKNLGIQAENEFQAYLPKDDHRRFTELYQVQRLTSSSISSSSKVCISTIQRMYSILREEELDDSLEEDAATDYKWGDKIREVVFNAKYPIEFFDFIVIDECHRSIYNLWQQVLDYFDAFQIGLTATPDKRTLGYFQKNIVSEYTREQAILDGVNVGNDEWVISTEISEKGGTLAGPYIEKRERMTRSKRWEQLDEPISYDVSVVNRSVVVPDQIRTILTEFKRIVITSIFKDRINDKGEFELPKTLIFAKDNSHADDIVQICREVFAEGNDFCKKITYNANNPQTVLNSFRNSYYPRVAVTVDMIATGTDVKPIECLLFMRDVRSKNYFEQMTGRGTRVLSLEELQKVSPTAITNKDRFVLFDAVGVLKSLKTENRTLDRKPTVSFDNLLMQIATGSKDEDVLTSVAGRITRLIQSCTKEQIKEFKEISPDASLNKIASDLLNCFDEDEIYKKALSLNLEPTEEDMEFAKQELLDDATKPFNNPKVRDFLTTAKKVSEQYISAEIDTISYSDYSEAQEERANQIRETFNEFIYNNIDEIDALSIIYNQQYKTRTLTYKMIDDLYNAISKPPYNITVRKLSDVYYIIDSSVCKSVLSKMVDIVSFVRYEYGQTEAITSYKDTVNRKFKDWIFKKNSGQSEFNKVQNEWLKAIRDHISSSGAIELDDFEYTPFSEKGGLGKFVQVFDSNYNEVLQEINVALQS